MADRCNVAACWENRMNWHDFFGLLFIVGFIGLGIVILVILGQLLLDVIRQREYGCLGIALIALIFFIGYVGYSLTKG